MVYPEASFRFTPAPQDATECKNTKNLSINKTFLLPKNMEDGRLRTYAAEDSRHIRDSPHLGFLVALITLHNGRLYRKLF